MRKSSRTALGWDLGLLKSVNSPLLIYPTQPIRLIVSFAPDGVADQGGDACRSNYSLRVSPGSGGVNWNGLFVLRQTPLAKAEVNFSLL